MSGSFPAAAYIKARHNFVFKKGGAGPINVVSPVQPLVVHPEAVPGEAGKPRAARPALAAAAAATIDARGNEVAVEGKWAEVLGGGGGGPMVEEVNVQRAGGAFAVRA